MSTLHPTADGLYPPTLLALLANQGSSGSLSAPATNPANGQNNYAGTDWVTTQLASKVTQTTPTPVATRLDGIETTLNTASTGVLARIAALEGSAPSGSAAVVFVEGLDNVHFLPDATGLNKLYVLQTTHQDNTLRHFYIDLPFDAEGNGSILLYNASWAGASIWVHSADSAFQTFGGLLVYQGPEVSIPAGKFMMLHRTDKFSSGALESGSSVSYTALYRYSLF